MHESINIKIDITNIVTPVNVFFNVFDIPLKSKFEFIDFAIDKQIEMLIIGYIKVNINLSVMAMKSKNDEVTTPLLVMLPVIINKVAISGANDSIILQRDSIKSLVNADKLVHMLNDVNATNRDVAKEKELEEIIDKLSPFNNDEISMIIIRKPRLLKDDSKPMKT